MDSGLAIAKENQPDSSRQSSTENSADTRGPGNHLEQKNPLFQSGVMAYRARNYEEAEKMICKAIELGHQSPYSYTMLGAVLIEKGKIDDAALYLNKAIELDPHYVDAYFKLGQLQYMAGRCEQSVECFKKCIQLRPEYHDAYFNLGCVFHKQGMLRESIPCYRRAIELQPRAAQSYFSLGSVYQQQGQLEKAIYYYQKVIELNPASSIPYNHMGIVLEKLNRFDQAISCYRKALEIDPEYVGTHMNMGNLYHANNMFKKATECYKRALKIEPGNAFIHFNMGNTWVCMGKTDDAQQSYKKALERNSHCDKSCARLMELMRSNCEWTHLDRLSHKLDQLTQSALDKKEGLGEYPFLNIMRHMDPPLNHAVAKTWSHDLSEDVSKTRESYRFEGRKRRRRKLRIGYLSNNFRNHPSAQLIIELFEKHNRGSFDIFCYSYGKDDGSYYRKHIEKMCDQFVELRKLNDNGAAEKIYLDEIDILVDLVGQTEGTRPGICAVRPAPIQVRYLGMAGTTGADYFDYIITDRIVTPETDAEFYSEKFVYMPHCYQINSSRVARTHQALTCQKVGLPEESFVFCCFNSAYKIDPTIFDVWMNILKRVSKGVLWLMKGRDKVESNLALEAEKRGVNRDRLFFTDKLPIQDHLARLQLADLALDTRVVSGAATTSDALWAGIPVITIRGGHFASRMSSSILSSLDLQELVADNLKAYEDLAVELALNSDALTAVRNKVKDNREIMPLFDTDRFVGNIETAYKNMYKNYVAGMDPAPIYVVEDPM